MNISIEDFCEDIIGKAMRGFGISTSQLSATSGVSEEMIEKLKSGHVDKDALLAIAPHLKLDGPSLVVAAEKGWYPQPIDFEGLFQTNTTWSDMMVNAYLVWDPATKKAAIFDSGTDATAIIEVVEREDLDVIAIYLTHTHADHIEDLGSLTKAYPKAPVYVHELELISGAIGINEGHTDTIGNLTLNTAHTSGHSAGGITFMIDGLEHPLAIVGDAIFAGSMGFGQISQTEALDNNRRKIFTLADETVLCPGHGPRTTVAEEKAHNPFYPEFKG